MNPETEHNTTHFLKLFVDNQKTVYSYIFAMVYDADTADDILQDTVTLMWERFDSYQEGTNFGAWGLTIARYKVLEYFRKNRHNYTSISDDLLEKISQVTQRRLETIDERISVLRSCIQKLNARDRRLLEIRYEREMKVKEIAKKINRPIQGLYQAMSRIHHVLLRCIESTLKQWEHNL